MREGGIKGKGGIYIYNERCIKDTNDKPNECEMNAQRSMNG